MSLLNEEGSEGRFGLPMTEILSKVTLDDTSPVPLYHQVAQALQEAIEDGRLPRGSKLESELELAGLLGISRPTMRAAIRELVDKGLVVRRRGVGTMVAAMPVKRVVALTSLYDDLDKAGRDPRTRVLALEREACSPEVADQLGLEPGSPVLRLERLRFAGADTIALMHNVIPAGLLEIAKEDLERTGLYEFLRQNGSVPDIASQRIGARKAAGEEVELLEVEPGDPLLTMTRTTYDASRRPLEYGSHVYPAESYWFEMTLAEP
jgi:DNA-binding GntR family transcriptional regulator